jgi:hypothetical protein
MERWKVHQGPLPDSIDPVWLEEFRKEGIERRKIDDLVRKLLGEDEEPEMSLGQFLMTFPKIDCDDSIFDRHAKWED